MISIEGVSKSFGPNKAVETISFQANDREILVLLGTSGCGKTTTLKMINRLIEPDSGTICIDGKNIRDQKPEALRKTIGFVMQHAGLFPHYTVEQNIATVPNLLNWEKQKIRKRTSELLEKLHLNENILGLYPYELSGGQQQRVGVARALMTNTPLLLMDEPFGALDTITKSAIHNEFKNLDELKNKTTILVTHDIVEAFELGHRICLMDKGQIVQIGSPREFLYHPVNSFVKEFFASNRLMLEYKIASVKTVEPFLKMSLSLKGQKELNKSANLWEALQIFSGEQSFNEDYEILVQAFNQYRKLQSV
ncbi:ABC transporter ATP-binding protein [Flavobacterium sp. ov086]|jgi:osmoprotectant transport system ATP-binding protein|uniref:ABC transporter ATP-binding protein n=1 Tax=Flavobacterium sp. ov086 TaxID=1761785 RepID=UPI000B6CB61B|nr:ABC transporter ATP-binding protein [Flavobacterium sp. ov086]SNR76632.1 osmoprotectant transport system ATP-binding protein [Flavobacterium sp. ov086]